MKQHFFIALFLCCLGLVGCRQLACDTALAESGLGTNPVEFLRMQAGEMNDDFLEKVLGEMDAGMAFKEGAKAFLEEFVTQFEEAAAMDTTARQLDAYFPAYAPAGLGIQEGLLIDLNAVHHQNHELIKLRVEAMGDKCASMVNSPDHLVTKVKSPVEGHNNLVRMLSVSAVIAFRETYTTGESYGYLAKAEELYIEKVLGGLEEEEEEVDTEPKAGTFEEMVAGIDSKKDSADETEALKEAYRRDHPLLGLFNLETPLMEDDAYLGMAKASKMAAISEILDHPEVRKAFPSNMEPTWSAKSETKEADGTGLFGLYPIMRPRKNSPAAELSDSHILNASYGDDGAGGWAVNLSLSGEGGALFEKLSRANIGRSLAILYDGRVITAPRVQAAISGGNIFLSGQFTETEAKEIAMQLGIGSLACPVLVLDE